jgi:hypothetical protein
MQAEIVSAVKSYERIFASAVVAELADATALGAVGRKAVEVRVLSTAPYLQ